MEDQKLLPQYAESIAHHVMNGKRHVYELSALAMRNNLILKLVGRAGKNGYDYDVAIIDENTISFADIKTVLAHATGHPLLSIIIKQAYAFDKLADSATKSAIMLKDTIAQCQFVQSKYYNERKQNRFARKQRFKTNKFF